MEIKMSEEREIPVQGRAPNPLLARMNKMPGITIGLPSQGLFYTNNELDSECVNGEVILYPMTTTDELMMRSADMLFQGKSIEYVIGRCAPQIKKPLELLMGDIDYILTQLRRVSYGSKIPITYECACAKTEEEKSKRRDGGMNEYSIPIDALIQTTKKLEPKDFNKTFKIKTSTGQEVTLQPLRFIDFITLQQMRDPSELSNGDEVRDYVSTSFAAVTKSVDEVVDKDFIKEWYDLLPRYDTDKIKDKLNKIASWGIEFKSSITCRHCSEVKDVTTQLNPVYFFMLPSSPETDQ